jgi:hypothetical protein
LQLDYKEQDSLRRYLLGDLAPGEIAALEERLLTDSTFYEELLMMEDELIDQYLTGEQSQAEREKFETHFSVAPERQEKVRFALTLKKYLSDTSEGQVRAVDTRSSLAKPISVTDSYRRRRSFFSFLPTNPMIAYSLAAALLLVAGVGFWITLNRLKNPGTSGSGRTLAVVLTPGLSRSGDAGEIKKISIPPATETLRLQLDLPKGDYASYRAELLTSERSSVSIIEGLRPTAETANKFVTVTLSTSLLKRDDYYVKLSGQRTDGVYEDVAGYVFRILN